MSVRIDENEAEMIEELATDAEIVLEQKGTRKDLKEKRGIMKQTLFNSSKKLKHIVPKGKQV